MKKLADAVIESYKSCKGINRIGEKNGLNREAVIQITEKLRRILFPGYFDKGPGSMKHAKWLVEKKLEWIRYHLKKQIARALRSVKEHRCCEESEIDQLADNMVTVFMERLPEIREYLETDIQAAYEGDPAAQSTDEIIFCYPGLFAITIYRIAHQLYLLGVPLIPRIMTEYAHGATGIDIHPGAAIGKYFFIDHGTGIVIGETTRIGKNVKIYQGVTLGALSTKKGQELKGVKRHPTIGDHVTIYSGTSILGGETKIGNGTTIGGNAFIVSSVLPGTKVSVKNPELQFCSGKAGKENADILCP